MRREVNGFRTLNLAFLPFLAPWGLFWGAAGLPAGLINPLVGLPAPLVAVRCVSCVMFMAPRSLWAVLDSLTATFADLWRACRKVAAPLCPWPRVTWGNVALSLAILALPAGLWSILGAALVALRLLAGGLSIRARLPLSVPLATSWRAGGQAGQGAKRPSVRLNLRRFSLASPWVRPARPVRVPVRLHRGRGPVAAWTWGRRRLRQGRRTRPRAGRPARAGPPFAPKPGPASLRRMCGEMPMPLGLTWSNVHKREVLLMAERKAGRPKKGGHLTLPPKSEEPTLSEMLAVTPRAKPPSGKGQAKHERRLRDVTDGEPPRLVDLGISKRESAEAQKLAALPEPEFQEVVAGKMAE